jgi:hypothetical protein
MDVFGQLSRTPSLLLEIVKDFPAALARTRSGGFALVEHAWHLADLEKEGFGARIERLLSEEDPFLPDFDGSRIARERRYLDGDLAGGIGAFAAARAKNLGTLRAIAPHQLRRTGRQEGVGPVALADIPERMRDHDLAHVAEIADLLADLHPAHPLLGALRALTQGGPRRSQAA